MLRYGDGTPCPLDEGFLELLADAVEACAAMLGATATLEQRREAAEAARRALADERRGVEELVGSVESACRGRSDPAAAQLAAAAREVLARTQQRLERRAQRAAATPRWSRTASRVQAAAGRFFDRHALPNTVWSWSWDATRAFASAEAHARATRFAVTFELELSAAWRAPLRVDAIAPHVVVQLPRPRMFGAAMVGPVALDRALLVAASRDASGRTLELRDGGVAWRIAVPSAGAPTAAAFDRRGHELGSGPVRAGELAPLLDAIDRAMEDHLRARRARLVMLDEAPLAQLVDTTAATRALLEQLGPAVRAIRARSKMPGELELKRDVAAGVREEVFVSRTKLAARYAKLPSEYRALLDAAGFGRGVSIIDELTESEDALAPVSGVLDVPSAPVVVEVPVPAALASEPTAPTLIYERSDDDDEPTVTTAPPLPSSVRPIPGVTIGRIRPLSVIASRR